MTETPSPPKTAEFGFVTPGGATHRYEDSPSLAVRKFSVGPFDNNVYIISCPTTNKALIVDGPSDPERILREVDGMEVVGIVETHGHPDHIQALPALVEALGAPVYAHGGDAPKMPVPTKPVRGGETMSVGDVEVTILHTPGHTPGGLSFLVGAYIFSGDTLFPGGPGNTNNKRPQFEEIMRSLDKLFELPDDTRVCPGHGLDTFIGRERPHLETWRARGW